MAFCEQCGTQLLESALFCAGCGKAITSSVATRSTLSSSRAVADDDFAGLPEKWRQRFAAIEKAGGERARWWRWPEVNRLTAKEKRLITSNLWAFVFGPCYYLYLGMWRKAITLSLVALALDVILGIAGDALDVPVARFLWIVSAVIFRQCANLDYYRKTILRRKEWW